MKPLSFIYIFVCVALVANAQSVSRPALSFGGDVGLPIKRSYNKENVAGFSAKLELPIAKKLRFTISPGYMLQGRAKFDYTLCQGCTPPVQVSEDYISLKAGLRYFYIPNLYTELDAGEAFKIRPEVGNTFLYGIGLGATMPFNPHNSIDIGLRLENRAKIRYQTQNDFLNQLGIRLAYRYQF